MKSLIIERMSINFMRIKIGPLEVCVSYDTPIAFYVTGKGEVVRENDWSATTGKHLNAIDGGNKAGRIPGAEFDRKLDEIVKKLIVSDKVVQGITADIIKLG